MTHVQQISFVKYDAGRSCKIRKIDRAWFLADARYHITLEQNASRQCYIPSSLCGQPPYWVIDRGEGQLIVQDGERATNSHVRRNTRDVRNIGNQGRDCTTWELN